MKISSVHLCIPTSIMIVFSPQNYHFKGCQNDIESRRKLSKAISIPQMTQQPFTIKHSQTRIGHSHGSSLLFHFLQITQSHHFLLYLVLIILRKAITPNNANNTKFITVSFYLGKVVITPLTMACHSHIA